MGIPVHFVFNCSLFRPEVGVRLEKIPDQLFDYSASVTIITEFFDDQKHAVNKELCKVDIVKEIDSQFQRNTCPAVEMPLNLPKSVQACFAALVQYLKDFKLEKILRLTRYGFGNLWSLWL